MAERAVAVAVAAAAAARVRVAFVAALLVAACASTNDLAGTYVGGLEATKTISERKVRITLKPDGAASVQASFADRPVRLFAEGMWKAAQEDVIIELTSGQRERLVFKRSGRQLVAREWDRAFWGEGGPGVLYPVR